MRPRVLNAAFRALGNHTRRDILQMLRNGRCTSGDVAVHFNSTWPTISRHLAVLRRAGLVKTKRSGHQMFYELTFRALHELTEYFDEWLDLGTRHTR